MEEHQPSANSEEECDSTAACQEIVAESDIGALSDVDSYTEYLPSPVPEFSLETESEDDDWPLGSGSSLVLPLHMYRETLDKVEFGKMRLKVLEGRLEQLRQLEHGELRDPTRKFTNDDPPPRAYQAILDSAARVEQMSQQLHTAELQRERKKAALLDRLHTVQCHHQRALKELTALKAEVLAAESIFHSRIQVWESLLQQKRDKKWQLKLALDPTNNSEQL